MKTLRLLILFLVCHLSQSLFAQNPIIRDQFTADPTARVFNGKMYLFPSHDIPAPDDYERKDWFCMADYHVFSSDNLTEWTDHGVIVSQENVPWGNPKGYSMWAPDCVEKNGKYYFFFPDAPGGGQRGFGIGVAVADRPEGPYTVMPEPVKGTFGIDPVVLQTSKGETYIFWAGGRLMGAKLNDTMTAVEGEPVEVSAPLPKGFKEGPFAFEKDGKFYLTYPWVEDKTETLAYAMSDNPLGPYEFKGKIMEQSPTGCWTNHHSLVEFKGQWYLFYHHNDYSPNFDKLRSARIDSLFFNADGTIQPVRPTLRGVGLSDARKPIQIDRYSEISAEGVAMDFICKDKNGNIPTDSLRRFEGWQLTYTGTEAYSTYNKVDFGQSPATTVTIRVKAPKGAILTISDLTSKMPQRKWRPRPASSQNQGKNGKNSGKKVSKAEIKRQEAAFKAWMDEQQRTWPVIANITVPSSDDFILVTVPLNKSPKGVIDIKVQSKDGREVSVDWIGFDLRAEQHAPLLSGAPLKPWQEGGFQTHKYRNLLAELGYTEQQIDNKVKELFDAVFTGPDRIYFEDGDDKAYISDVKNHDVRTEGMSYGLMLAVQFDRKDIFDRLWRWAKTNMQMTSGKQKGYFKWSLAPDGSRGAMGAASDGELYFITSLIFASNRWGNDTGINYLAEAQYILDCCMGKEGQFTLFDPATKLIRFVPGAAYTDPSYHLPAFYEVWAKWANDGRSDYWNECARASREYLHKSIHPLTGLNPDYNNFDGTLMKTGMTLGDAFRYDSWRVPMNIALDYSWSCADKDWQRGYGHLLQNFLYSEGIDSFLDQYNVDGTTVTDIMEAGGKKELRHTPGFIATSAALSLVCEHSKAREFVDRFWNSRHEPTESGYFDAYYEGILRLFAVMHLSGRYRVIEPMTK